MTQNKAEELLNVLEVCFDKIQDIAFKIPPVNAYTPQIVQTIIHCRNLTNQAAELIREMQKRDKEIEGRWFRIVNYLQQRIRSSNTNFSKYGKSHKRIIKKNWDAISQSITDMENIPK